MARLITENCLFFCKYYLLYNPLSLLCSEEYESLVQKLAEEQAKVQENETKIAVMTMLKEGSVPETLPLPGRNVKLYKLLQICKHLLRIH